MLVGPGETDTVLVISGSSGGAQMKQEGKIQKCALQSQLNCKEEEERAH